GVEPEVDAYIVELAGGNQVLRMSNATTSGNYGFTHAAPPEVELAGESTIASNNRFQFSFDFKAAVEEVQEGLFISGPTAWQTGTSTRHALFYITDDATNGFSIGIYDTIAGGAFRFTPLATGLDRT